MQQPKINFEQFITTVEAEHQMFMQNLHSHLLEQGCKVTFVEKKSGYLASYKAGKPPRALANVLFRKEGMLVRIYGERIGGYPNFLNTLPQSMVQSIESAGACGRLVNNTCSPKCAGYDFTIGDAHFQKCRYNCFEFLVTAEHNPFIQQFLAHELKERMQ